MFSHSPWLPKRGEIPDGHFVFAVECRLTSVAWNVCRDQTECLLSGFLCAVG